MILRKDPRFVQDFGTSLNGRNVYGVNGGARGCGQRKVDGPNTMINRKAEPQVREPVRAGEPDRPILRTAHPHRFGDPDRGEHPDIERRRGIDVLNLQADVIHHSHEPNAETVFGDAVSKEMPLEMTPALLARR